MLTKIVAMTMPIYYRVVHFVVLRKNNRFSLKPPRPRTPGGKAMTYRSRSYGIWRKDVSGGEPKRLEGLPAEKLCACGWSRDDKQFAFARGTEIREVVLISNTK